MIWLLYIYIAGYLLILIGGTVIGPTNKEDDAGCGLAALLWPLLPILFMGELIRFMASVPAKIARKLVEAFRA